MVVKIIKIFNLTTRDFPIKEWQDKWEKEGPISQTAFEYLKSISLPVSTEGGNYLRGRPSNGEIKRWLSKGSVIINGRRPGPEDKINFPIKQLIFFPNGKRRTTFCDYLNEHTLSSA